MAKHSMREHLRAMHTAHADFCSKAASSISAMSKCMAKAADGADEKIGAVYQQMSASAEELATHFVSAGEVSAASARELSEATSYKADDDADLDKLMPSGAKLFPMSPAPNIRAVERYGQRPVPVEAANMPTFVKNLLGSDADDWS